MTVTVGPLLDAQVAAGQRVRALAPVGRLGLGHGPALGPGHGPAHVPAHGMALHLGLRVDGVYLDPLPYLLDRPRPRLAPLLRPGGLAGPEPGASDDRLTLSRPGRWGSAHDGAGLPRGHGAAQGGL